MHSGIPVAYDPGSGSSAWMPRGFTASLSILPEGRAVQRGFRHVGREEAYLMGILGGTDAGRVSWTPQVLEQARQTGLQLDAQDNLVES